MILNFFADIDINYRDIKNIFFQVEVKFMS